MQAGLGGLTEADQLGALDSEWDIPCDYADQWFCSKEGARWVAHGKCPECGYVAQRLICNPCKEMIVKTEHGCLCWGCPARTVPFRKYIVRIEPLDRRAA